MESVWKQAGAIIGSGAVIGIVAWFIQSPDFEMELAPPEEASAEEMEALLEENPTQDESVQSDEIPVPKMVSFLDVASRFFGQPNVTFIDARDEGTFEAGHIPGALNIDAERLDSDALIGAKSLEKTPKTNVLIVYCSGGQCDLSKRLASNLIARGFLKVLVFEGGWNEWTDEGQPVEEGLGGEVQ